MPNGSRHLPRNHDFQLKFHPKLVPKLVPKRDPFRYPLFSKFFACGIVLSHLKTTRSANFRKNGPPFWEPFWLKIRKNGGALIKYFGSGARSPSVLRFWVPPPSQDGPLALRLPGFWKFWAWFLGGFWHRFAWFYVVSSGAWFADGLVRCRASRIE